MCTRFSSARSEEHTSELQSRLHLVCRLLLEIKIRSEEHTSELQSRLHLVCRLLLDKTVLDRHAVAMVVRASVVLGHAVAALPAAGPERRARALVVGPPLL